MNNYVNNTYNAVVLLAAIMAVALVVGIIKVRNLNEDINELTERISKLEKASGGTNYEEDTYDVSLFKEISISDIASESKKETIVVWLGLPTCGYCKAYAPLLAEVADEYGIVARYVDVSAMTQEDYDILVSLSGKGDYDGFGASFTGTPFTMIIKNNQIIGGINGYVEKDSIVEAFENAGIKK